MLSSFQTIRERDPFLPANCIRWFIVCSLSMICLVVFSVAVPATAADTAAKSTEQEIEELIQQLGAAQFVVREDATKRLFHLGHGNNAPAVMNVIERAAQQSDREIRERAKRALALLKKQIQERGLEQFRTGEESDSIPGWKEFSEKYGETKVCRDVYSMMLKDEWELMADCFPISAESEDDDKPEDREEDPESPLVKAVIRDAINRRYAKATSSQFRQRSLPLGSLLSFYFVGERYPESFDLKANMFNSMISAPLLSQQLRGVATSQDSPKRVIRGMVANWMLSTVKQNHNYANIALSNSLNLRMESEAKLLATDILTQPNSLIVTKRTAMQTFVILKDPSGIEVIERFLDDETKLQPGRNKLQLRDIALVCVMELYGFDVAKIGVRKTNTANNPFHYPSLGFDTDEQRKEAFELFAKLKKAKQEAEE